MWIDTHFVLVFKRHLVVKIGDCSLKDLRTSQIKGNEMIDIHDSVGSEVSCRDLPFVWRK